MTYSSSSERIASSSGGCSYSSSVLRQTLDARAAVSRLPFFFQRSKFSVEDSSGR
jgi:hypothetical protein